MFVLNLYDRKGKELKLGDFVKISDGKMFTFFAEVKYLPEEKFITPFHTFSFHSFEKVDSVPAAAKQSTEERYKIWYVCGEDAEADNEADDFKTYLMNWRQCDNFLKDRCYRIELINEVS
jgi:hypothetical protein